MLNRRHFLSATGASLALTAMKKPPTSGSIKPNIVFISVDDLNDWISPLSHTDGKSSGYPGVQTPNLQFLADRGTCFRSAYAHVPACSPSRTSLLLGVSADKTGVYYNGQRWEDAKIQNKRTLFDHFQSHGWKTTGLGKLFHGDVHSGLDEQFNYQEKNCESEAEIRRLAPLSANSAKNSRDVFGKEMGDCHWSYKADELHTDKTRELIESQFSSGGNFVGLGLSATHLPWIAPKKFYDIYEGQDLPLPPGFFPNAKTIGDNVADINDLPKWGKKLITSSNYRKRLSNIEVYQDLLRSYLGNISFIDDCIGQVVKSLESQNLLDNTYFVIWSDHGMSLGEKLSFKKFTLWERALRVPFIICGPGIQKQVVDDPVSLLDIYPTLSSLLGLPVPPACNGRDLSATLTTGRKIIDPQAIAIYGRGASSLPQDDLLSVKVHTQEWNYIKHPNGDGELYHRRDDPHEWYNLFASEKKYQSDAPLIQSLASKMPTQLQKPKTKYRSS